ncbi:MAG: hypothetical protein WAK82_09600 [Streptosporangiaceae bacterium]
MAVSEELTTAAEREAAEVERANASRLTPVVFVRGLWLLLSNRDRRAEAFEAAGTWRSRE